MALTHSTPFRNAMAAGGLALLNGGSANAAGILRPRTAANVVVAALTLSNPATQTPSGGQAVFNAITPDTAAVGGVIAQMTIEDRDRVTHITLNDIRTTAGGDAQGNNLTVAAGATVQVLSASWIAPQ